MVTINISKQLQDIKRIDKLFESTIKKLAKKYDIKLEVHESINEEFFSKDGIVDIEDMYRNKNLVFFSASLKISSHLAYEEKSRLKKKIENEMKIFQKKASKIHKIKWAKMKIDHNYYIITDIIRYQLKGFLISHKVFVYIKDNNLGAKRKLIKVGSYINEDSAREGHELHYGMVVDTMRKDKYTYDRVDIIRYFTRRYQPIEKQVIKKFKNRQDARDYFQNLEFIYRAKVY